ncbi:putative iron-regulated membrane protein [Marinimicrobium koreense]|uniref:Putative iron-regulated membrane protein n=1 Tax=Marinimicrobium koreense TaxID=306545 RepID=A0A3N1NZF4_9GAMM|nr:PepSY domain-containing protein [Marinimicrobium koreense]ROQ21503.1 putative iron-regulated membrane protein [Marinimicrobium koreense]
MNQATFPDKESHHQRSTARAGHWYRTLWRWHFYAGLFCIPFVVILSVTGGIYLFKPQLDHWAERDFRNLATAGKALPIEKQIEHALVAYPDAMLVNIRVTANTQDAHRLLIRQGGETIHLYVHPATGEVLQANNPDRRLTAWVKNLHGELLIGTAGSILVELAACWAFVLLMTGVYLWWPRGQKGLGGVLYPRLRKGGRTFWRDLHAVIGFWLVGLTFFLLITALPWSQVWGSAFKELRQLASGPTEHSWRISSHSHGDRTSYDTPLPTTKVWQQARALEFAPPVELSWDHQRHHWKVASQHQNRPLRQTAWLDSDTGELIESNGFSEKGALDKAIGIGIAAHEGHLFGWLNQLLGLLTALGLITVCVSGAVMWWRRRPEKRLGAPKPVEAHTGKVIGGLVLLLGVLLPVVGLSLIALWMMERWVVRRFKSVAVWLGVYRDIQES